MVTDTDVYDPARRRTYELPYGFRLQTVGTLGPSDKWTLFYRLFPPGWRHTTDWSEPEAPLSSLAVQAAIIKRQLESLLSEHYPRLMKAPGNHFAKAALLTGGPPDDPEPEVLGPNWWNSETTPENLQLPNRHRWVYLNNKQSLQVTAAIGGWALSWDDPLKIKTGEAPRACVDACRSFPIRESLKTVAELRAELLADEEAQRERVYAVRRASPGRCPDGSGSDDWLQAAICAERQMKQYFKSHFGVDR